MIKKTGPRVPDGKKIRFQTCMAKAIRRLRIERGYTQEDVAAHTGISSSMVDKIEDGTTAAPSYVVYLLAYLFDVTTDQIMVDPDDVGDEGAAA